MNRCQIQFMKSRFLTKAASSGESCTALFKHAAPTAVTTPSSHEFSPSRHAPEKRVFLFFAGLAVQKHLCHTLPESRLSHSNWLSKTTPSCKDVQNRIVSPANILLTPDKFSLSLNMNVQSLIWLLSVRANTPKRWNNTLFRSRSQFNWLSLIQLTLLSRIWITQGLAVFLQEDFWIWLRRMCKWRNGVVQTNNCT